MRALPLLFILRLLVSHYEQFVGVVILLAGCSTRYMMRNCLWKRLWPPYAEL